MKLYERLKEVRTQGGLTLVQVKERTGLSVSYLSDLERGRTQNPSLGTINKLANCYGMSTTDLLGGVEGWREPISEVFPPGVADLLNAGRIDETAARDLSRVEFRGKTPQTEDEWFQLYLYLRSMMKPYLES